MAVAIYPVLSPFVVFAVSPFVVFAVSPFVVFAVSPFVVRVGSVGLRMAGLTPEAASFQAASAFSGAGFTTQESEHAVSTPERRATVKALIRLGSLGPVSVIAPLVLSFTNANGDDLRSLLLSTGVFTTVFVARSDWLDRAHSAHRARARTHDRPRREGVHRDARPPTRLPRRGGRRRRRGRLTHGTPADAT